MSFENKVVLVTGASSGIGAATAIEFAKEGANVVIVGRNENKLKNVYEKCKKIGKEPLVIKADVSIDADAIRIIDVTIKQFEKLDVLINNAGVGDPVDINSDNFMKDHDRVMNINLRAAVYITHLAIPHLIKTRGNIINISSVAATSSLGSLSAISYCVSKAGLNHFSRGTALKLASHGIRVNIVSPGPVRTNIIDNTPVTWDYFLEQTALKRVSDPEEIADLILFLASDKAKGITGSEFVSDNGILIAT